MMHQNQPSPTLESVSGKFSADEMEALVAKMLMKRPADRYQSMNQVVHDLNRIGQQKAVGKNVETGFKSSVDSQLEDMGSRYETDQPGRSRNKKIWNRIVVAAVGFVAAASLFMLINVARPEAQVPKSTLATSHITSVDIVQNMKQADPVLAAATKKIQAVKSITSSIDKADGKRVFHCPDLRLGMFEWWSGPKDVAGFALDPSQRDKVVACGDARVPAGEPVFLVIDESREREAWRLPLILEKFGPKELVGIKLKAFTAIDGVGSDDVTKEHDQQIIALVRATLGWTNCRYFELSCVSAPDQVLVELDKDQALRHFVVRNSSINVKVLAQRQFLHRLAGLELAQIGDCDTVLCALKGSPSIRSVRIENSSMPARSLKALAGCPNLSFLRLEQCPLDNSGLEAISTIKSLKRLMLGKIQLPPEQIPALARLRYIDSVELSKESWSQLERQAVSKVLPSAQLAVCPPSASLW
jgi:hypothetical protein